MPNENQSPKWWAGQSEEFYEVGPCESANKAYEEFASTYGKDSDVYLGTSETTPVLADGVSFLNTLLDLIDGGDEFNEDAGNEFSDAVDEVTTEATDELSQKLNEVWVEWAKKHRVPYEFEVITQRECRKPVGV